MTMNSPVTPLPAARASADGRVVLPPVVGAASRSAFFGGAIALRAARELPVELDERWNDRLAELVRRSLGLTGQLEVVGRTLTWRSVPLGARATDGRNVTLTVSRVDGTTTIRLEEDLTPDLTGAFAPLMGIGGVGAIIAIGMGGRFGLAAIALAPLIAGTAYAFARTLFAGLRRRRATELADTLRAIDDALASAQLLPPSP